MDRPSALLVAPSARAGQNGRLENGASGAGPGREKDAKAREDDVGGDSFEVLLGEARGAPRDASEAPEAEPQRSPLPLPPPPPPPQSLASPRTGTVTCSGRDLQVRFDRDVFTLATSASRTPTVAGPPTPRTPTAPGTPPTRTPLAPPTPMAEVEAEAATPTRTPAVADPPSPRTPPAPPRPVAEVGAEHEAEAEEVAATPPEDRRLVVVVATTPKSAGPPAYTCPEPQCPHAFAKKHQLQVHRLSHGRRPFRCPLDGCGWAFATSYKLKRHLQAHGKLRPFGCPAGGCGKKFTTVYNLRAHMKGHEQARAGLFQCEVCAQRFPTHAKLSSHQRSHFEPERPYKCDFPGCEKTFITVSALFSHNRAHFREQELFSCSFPGCSKQYDKACRLKIHLRSHTGERPFICDSDSCGWTFTSMSKLLRHKRKHDDDRRFTCPVEGCGKSFTRAEHLKGHSITHLGTKPFECPVEGCCAKFSARSSLYIHSKKHVQDVGAPKSRCPVSSCNRLFTSKHSMKAHVARQHSQHPDLFPQLGASNSLTSSSELSSPAQNELNNLDLAALFSDAPSDSSTATGTPDEALNSGMLTIDVTSVSSSLGGPLPSNTSSLGPMEPLVLVAHSDIPPSLDSPLVLGPATTVLPQSSFSMDDVQAMGAGALGCLVALPVKNWSPDPQTLPSSSHSTDNTSTPTPASAQRGNSSNSIPELLTPVKVELNSPPGLDAIQQQEHSSGLARTVFSSPAEKPSQQKDTGLSAGDGCFYLDSGGSARTDSRAIQLAKEKKQRGTGSYAGASGSVQRKVRASKDSLTSFLKDQSSWLHGNLVASGGLPGPTLASGLPCMQVQLLQDDLLGDGVLPLTLSPLPPAFSPLYAAVDLPVYVFEEVSPSDEDTPGSQNPPCTGSTINLQDLH